MLIGEGPGEQEDKRGEAFVGRAGDLLTKMLAAIDLPRERVYICNTVKCRPPKNRTPKPDELEACKPHLLAQIALVKPNVVFLLGATAVRVMLGPNYRITQCRGQWYERSGNQNHSNLPPRGASARSAPQARDLGGSEKWSERSFWNKAHIPICLHNTVSAVQTARSKDVSTG